MSTALKAGGLWRDKVSIALGVLLGIVVCSCLLCGGCEVPGIDDDSQDLTEIKADNGSTVNVNKGPGSIQTTHDESTSED